MQETHDLTKGHGRIEERTLEATELLNKYLDWPGVQQVCRIRRKREVRGKESQETVYAITSLSRQKASAGDLLQLSRSHWGIENRLHCVRDVTFQEDRCRVRTGHVPQVLAALRNVAIRLIRCLGFSNVAEGREHFMDSRWRTIRVIRSGRTKCFWGMGGMKKPTQLREN